MIDRPTFDIARAGHTFHCAGDGSLDLDRPLVCVTGARRATPYGLALAAQAAEAVARAGLVLLTTASIGCSAEAARTALDAGGEVVVVSGSGCNVPYPAACGDVFERADLVISLREPDAGPTRHSFRERDAIIPALADTLVVCECGMPSGCLSLADAMLANERRVLAYPGSVLSPESRGTNALIKAGATMLASTHDLESLLGCATIHGAAGKAIDDPVLRAIVASPSRPDELAHALGMPVLDVLRRLASLEADGTAQRLPDGRYCFVPQA